MKIRNGRYTSALVFSSGTIESTNEKYKTVINWLIDQELSFEMISNEGARTLFVTLEDDDLKKFNREFNKLGFYLE